MKRIENSIKMDYQVSKLKYEHCIFEVGILCESQLWWLYSGRFLNIIRWTEKNLVCVLFYFVE